jgi:hypothetical protein
MRAIDEETRADGHRVVRAKGYTDYAVAMSAALVEKRYLCRPGSLPCRPPAAYSRRVRGCLYEGPRLVSCDRSIQTEYRRIHQSSSCRHDRTARVGPTNRRALRGCLWPYGGRIGLHAAAPCSLLNGRLPRPVNAYGEGDQIKPSPLVGEGWVGGRLRRALRAGSLCEHLLQKAYARSIGRLEGRPGRRRHDGAPGHRTRSQGQAEVLIVVGLALGVEGDPHADLGEMRTGGRSRDWRREKSSRRHVSQDRKGVWNDSETWRGRC